MSPSCTGWPRTRACPRATRRGGWCSRAAWRAARLPPWAQNRAARGECDRVGRGVRAVARVARGPGREGACQLAGAHLGEPDLIFGEGDRAAVLQAQNRKLGVSHQGEVAVGVLGVGLDLVEREPLGRVGCPAEQRVGVAHRQVVLVQPCGIIGGGGGLEPGTRWQARADWTGPSRVRLQRGRAGRGGRRAVDDPAHVGPVERLEERRLPRVGKFGGL